MGGKIFNKLFNLFYNRYSNYHNNIWLLNHQQMPNWYWLKFPRRHYTKFALPAKWTKYCYAYGKYNCSKALTLHVATCLKNEYYITLSVWLLVQGISISLYDRNLQVEQLKLYHGC